MNNPAKRVSVAENLLFNSSTSSFNLKFLDLILANHNDSLLECRLILKVNSQLYQQIDAESLFNLKRELRGSLNAIGFQNEIDIEIEVTLQPQFLTQLTEHAIDSETAIAYLTACSQQNSDASLGDFNNESEADLTDESTQHPCPNPLLSTESWFALNVRQHLESGEIGYRTFWSYVNPAILTPEAISIGQFSEAMEQFLKDRNEADLSMVGKAISEAVEEMANSFKDWDETEFLKQTETAISEIFAEVTKAFESWTDPGSVANSPISVAIGKIYQSMINFFSEDDWAFAKLQGEPTLRLAFKGKNGQWNCYARAIEEKQQFIFYSIAPLKVPGEKQGAMLEFLTRANTDVVVGNFEFNFDHCEIRYKTSIDVEGDRLTPALIKRLVYTNVVMMDEYLPGIQAVLIGATPIAAIQAIEPPYPNISTPAPASEP